MGVPMQFQSELAMPASLMLMMYSISSTTFFIDNMFCLYSSKQPIAKNSNAVMVSKATWLAHSLSTGSTTSISFSSSTFC